ncbi:LysE family translocator [Paraflavitalea pollutisoli]|uniref:LysE family translocator n=1 Tax=Paraflavitalea pollutisoli TaxID=3034143 RepID=UPI0023ED9313|nr:LysE family transporter [Paraflavitalea sp. H1-2-19X]
MKLLRIFFTGLFISFLGTLPLGTLNVAAMQISVSDGIRPALYFAIGALIIEMIYVRLSLVAMDWVRKQKKLFRWLEWFTLLIVVALAVTTFIAAAHPSGSGKNIILSSTIHRFWLGVSMSAINPMQIPFWFGWSTVLFTKKVLLPRADHYNTYIVGIGIGTFIGNLIFIFGGHLMVDKLNANQNVVNWVIGGIFAVTAVIMAIKMWRGKDAAEQL